MRVELDFAPKVIGISDALGKPVLHVVGMLWKLWSWADAHSLDGNALSVTEMTLDRIVDCAGFADALRKVGWLEGREGLLSFPRFAEHNGQTAKARALTQKRLQRFRSKKMKRSCNAPVTHQTLPEKRRCETSSTQYIAADGTASLDAPPSDPQEAANPYADDPALAKSADIAKWNRRERENYAKRSAAAE